MAGPRFVNLTPHPVCLPMDTFPTEGLAWCEEITTPVPSAPGIRIYRRTYGEVSGLPEPEPGVIYIVSAIVRQACPTRTDLATPVRLVRDERGNVIGCRALVVN